MNRVELRQRVATLTNNSRYLASLAMHIWSSSLQSSQQQIFLKSKKKNSRALIVCSKEKLTEYNKNMQKKSRTRIFVSFIMRTFLTADRNISIFHLNISIFHFDVGCAILFTTQKLNKSHNQILDTNPVSRYDDLYSLQMLLSTEK